MTFISENYLTVLFCLNLLLSLAIIFLERKNTAQTWAWLLVLMFVPIVGFILYIFVGRGISKDRIFDLRLQDRLGLQEELANQKKKLQDGTFPLPNMQTVDAKQLIYMMTVYDNSLFTTNNEVKLFTDGTIKFDALLEDIANARHHVHIQYYIYRNDDLGIKVRDALIKAAKRGVQVRLLIDAWGSTGVGKNFFQPLKDVGGQIQDFFPIFLPYINPRLNYRNHRKIVVIDGQIGYTGGFNVGNEYLGKVEKFGYWRDNHLRIYGEAVYSLQNRFLMDWNSQHKPKAAIEPEYFPVILSTGNKDIQIVTSGPDSEHEQIKMVYLKMINTAKKEILIQTPYYIPDDSIHEALKLAMLSGVKVHLQIPNKPDHMLVYWATYSFAAELLDLGAIIETYENGFIHAKTMIVDEEVVSVGSANIDIRSFRLDFEVNAVVYSKETAQEVKNAFLEDSKKSKVLTKEIYRKRGFIIKIKEGLARLISPLL
ncbi:cardiolipin synthase [Vagococcus entomophilus]|uniref:Cardiolipin synthase n=1 Tax=Vagococcus entomophilus TaxID=1160095 RepID=A0A430AIK2_9ENTE|nr:cardiolipin synthase [Vagococcus entomophilus]RSU07915.1 cardiolipin synthase [Vagococcus entomophilus]